MIGPPQPPPDPPPPDPIAPDGSDPDLPPPPAPAPRKLTRPIRRRAWSERHVRIWWMLSLAMTVIAAYYAISRLHVWRAESQLIQHGQQVQAEVMGANPLADAPPRQIYSPDVAVDLKYTWNGQTYRVHGVLGGRTEQIVSRTQIPIVIDPADPSSRWTARTQPGSLTQEMLSAMMLVPFAVVLFAMALWRRWQVLSIYRDGEGVLAEVIGVSHSAAHPLSRLLRCAVHVGNEARVIKILLPAAIAPGVGQGVWLIAPPGRAEAAIPAGLFE